jgi:hypothetical protein
VKPVCMIPCESAKPTSGSFLKLRILVTESPSMSFCKPYAHEFTHRAFFFHQAVVLVLWFLSGREPGGFQRQSLKLPTRVGYRTNVCRRRLASDSARASEGTPAQGALEDHHDRPPGSPPEKVEQLNSSCHRSAHLLTDGPDEAGKLSRDRGDDDGGLLASGDQ